MGFFGSESEVTVELNVAARRSGRTPDGGSWEIQVMRTATVRGQAVPLRDLPRFQRAVNLAERDYVEGIGASMRSMEWRLPRFSGLRSLSDQGEVFERWPHQLP